jgi:hypothetical protein
MSNRDTRGTARSRPGARATVVSPTRRSERVAERVVSPSPPRGRARVSTPAPPAPRHSQAQEPEEGEAPRGWLLLRYDEPNAWLLVAAALLAMASHALCLLPVAWPRGSPVRDLCQGAWAGRLHDASMLPFFLFWLLSRELHRLWRVAIWWLAQLALGPLAGWCAPARRTAS